MAALRADGAERCLPIGWRHRLSLPCAIAFPHTPTASARTSASLPDIHLRTRPDLRRIPADNPRRESIMSDQAGCRILVISPTAARAHQFVERMHPSRLAPLARAQ